MPRGEAATAGEEGPWRCCGRGRGSTGRFEAPPETAPTESLGKFFACANHLTSPQERVFFLGGGIDTANLPAHAVIMPLRALAQCCKRLFPLLAAPTALLLSQGQAKAILNVNIFDDGPNLKVSVNGSISGSPGTYVSTTDCGISGVLWGEFDNPSSLLCTGNDSRANFYSISGPAGFGGNGFLIYASTIEGFSFWLSPSSGSTYPNTYQLDSAYILGQPFFSSATFNGKSLASEGFTATGLVGAWTIDGTTESINVYVGAPSAAAARAAPQCPRQPGAGSGLCRPGPAAWFSAIPAAGVAGDLGRLAMAPGAAPGRAPGRHVR